MAQQSAIFFEKNFEKGVRIHGYSDPEFPKDASSGT